MNESYEQLSSMSINHETTDFPPIYRIVPDILYLIFTLNSTWDQSSLGSEPKLDTLRRTSQVCQTWRKIILETPSMWGRSIDFDCLYQKTDHRRNLVVQRTGNSPLCITGRSPMKPESGVSNYLVNLLDEEWARIQTVNIILRSSILDTTRVWNILGRPNRTLKNFYIFVLPHNSVPVNRPTNFQIFSNVAPSLTRLNLSQFFGFPLYMNAPMMFSSNLCDLIIAHPLVLKDIDLLMACDQMPSLETLDISISTLTIGQSSDNDSLRPSMHKLCSINICSPTLDIYPAFLDRVIPLAGRRLRVMHRAGSWSSLPQVKIETMQRVIKRYADSFLECCGQNIAVELDVISESFKFKPDSTQICGFDMTVVRHFADPLPFFRQLLDTIPTINFPSRKIIHFSFFPFNTPALIETPAMIQVIKHMRCISLLTSSILDIGRLGKLSEEDINFPCIKTICVQGPHPTLSAEPELDINEFFNFLARRHTIAPIEVLDLTCQPYLDDFRLLNGLPGLKVVYQNGRYRNARIEYICGTGDGKKLLLLPEYNSDHSHH